MTALSVVRKRPLDPMLIATEKARTLKKGGLLEIVETQASLADVGGLDALKLYAAYDAGREVGQDDVIEALRRSVPLSVTMAEDNPGTAPVGVEAGPECGSRPGGSTNGTAGRRLICVRTIAPCSAG